MLLHLEHHWGSGWAYAPGRWRTTDGWVAYRVVAVYWQAMAATRAMDRYHAALAARIGAAVAADAKAALHDALDTAMGR